jgi:putative hydrolase of the HAD superfamily
VIALLDLDGTLVDRDAGFASWVAAFAAEFGLGEDGMSWLYRWDHEARERGRFFAGVVEHFRLTAEPDQLGAGYRRFMPEATPLFPGIATGLGALRADGWRLAVLTNGRHDSQLGKLRRHGLLDLVDACCVSADTGLRKPDRRAFEMAISVLEPGTCPTQAWAIGDDPHADVDGGAQTGLSTIWVSHGRAYPCGLTPPTCVAVTPAEALGQLLKIGRALSSGAG